MNRSTPGLPVHHQLQEFTQTHVHRVGDATQPSHPLSSPSPPGLPGSYLCAILHRASLGEGRGMGPWVLMGPRQLRLRGQPCRLCIAQSTPQLRWALCGHSRQLRLCVDGSHCPADGSQVSGSANQALDYFTSLPTDVSKVFWGRGVFF